METLRWNCVECLFFMVGGGGGKGTWGKNGEVYEDDEFDPNDPNYDTDAIKVKTIKLFLFLFWNAVERVHMKVLLYDSKKVVRGRINEYLAFSFL